jgi:hypothetical protein
MNAPEPEAEMEASDLGRFEPTPYDLGISDDPELGWADTQPGEREFCAQAAASYPEYEREAGEAAAARTDELERQAAELGLDVFDGVLPDAQAPGPEADADQRVPYTLTAQAEEELALAAEADAELDAPEWDDADSNAHQARVEAGLEPEAGL